LEKQTFLYEIDVDDRIISLSQNWLQFAEENDGGETCAPDRVLHQPLWNFITGEATRHLYRILIRKVRTGAQPIDFPFRCDSSVLRRFFQMNISPLPMEHIEFKTILYKVEPRAKVSALEKNAKRSAENMLTICSFCKKVRLSENEWVEIETAVERLNLFGDQEFPLISHGVCPTCFDLCVSKL
jgi:hypothetical protein